MISTLSGVEGTSKLADELKPFGLVASRFYTTYEGRVAKPRYLINKQLCDASTIVLTIQPNFKTEVPRKLIHNITHMLIAAAKGLQSATFICF